jgi:hypothetical protein
MHMANESNALARPPKPGGPSKDDYQLFCAALSANARGRAFLAEYAQRNRHADTKVVLAALDRLEALVARHTPAPAADRIRQELRALLAAIRVTRPEIDDSAAAIKAAKLAALIAFVEHRIAAIVEPAHEHSALPDELAALFMPAAAVAETARSGLAMVPAADEPELPIPSPAGTPPPPMTLVRTAAIMPEVTFVGSAPPEPMTTEKPLAAPAFVENPVAAPSALIALPVLEASANEASANEAITNEASANNVPAPQAPPSPVDPLAAIMALSEDERIALFT